MWDIFYLAILLASFLATWALLRALSKLEGDKP